MGKERSPIFRFPELKDRYQSFTEADISKLRDVGYGAAFVDPSSGVRAYLDRLDEIK